MQPEAISVPALLSTRTLELRQHASTIEPVEILAQMGFLFKMVEHAQFERLCHA